MRRIHTNKHCLLVLVLFLTLASGIVLLSSTVSADNDSVVDEINITVPVSCTISGTGMTSHNASINNGLYEDDIGSTTLHAFCNDADGFAIYAAGYTGDEVGGTNSNKLVGTIASGNAIIETGLATTAGNPDVSNWAMKLTATQDSGDTTGINAFTIDSAPNTSGGADASFTQYHVVPNEYTKVAHKNSGTDMTVSTGGVKLTTTYAAYISKTQPADTYSGQVIYTLVHPSDAPDPGPKSIDTAITLQDVTFCKDTLVEGQVYTLIDSRDNQEYKVARLADGKCWMLDNLALDPTDANTAANMSASNTNATAEAIMNYLNGGSSNVGWSNIAVANATSGFSSFTAPNINNAYRNTLVTSYGPASTNGQAKMGIYYNYCAATVGTYCFTSGSDADIPDTIIDAPQDVCPVNWRMPTGGASGEYVALYNKYNTTMDATNTASLQYNLSTSLSGFAGDRSAFNQGLEGGWWSSTYYNDGLMYILHVYPLYVAPDSYYTYRSNGYAMRCLVGE